MTKRRAITSIDICRYRKAHTTLMAGGATEPPPQPLQSAGWAAPMLLVCINKMTSTHKAIIQAQVFAVNILRQSQSAVARQLATSHVDKFHGMRVSYGVLGAPLLNDTLAAIQCRVVEELAGGTHSVFLAEVLSAQAATGMPLTYFRGRMGRFEFITGGDAVPLWRHMQWQDYD